MVIKRIEVKIVHKMLPNSGLLGWKEGVREMSQSSAKEISSLLVSRSVGPEANPFSRPVIHKDWDEVSRASLVILWGLLIYPRLDPDQKKQAGEPGMGLDQVYRLFSEHLGTALQWKNVLNRLKAYDYIRLSEGNQILAGTRLWTAVDAGEMYRIFRSSVLVRQMRTEPPSNKKK